MTLTHLFAVMFSFYLREKDFFFRSPLIPKPFHPPPHGITIDDLCKEMLQLCRSIGELQFIADVHSLVIFGRALVHWERSLPHQLAYTVRQKFPHLFTVDKISNLSSNMEELLATQAGMALFLMHSYSSRSSTMDTLIPRAMVAGYKHAWNRYVFHADLFPSNLFKLVYDTMSRVYDHSDIIWDTWVDDKDLYLKYLGYI